MDEENKKKEEKCLEELIIKRAVSLSWSDQYRRQIKDYGLSITKGFFEK